MITHIAILLFASLFQYLPFSSSSLAVLPASESGFAVVELFTSES